MGIKNLPKRPVLVITLICLLGLGSAFAQAKPPYSAPSPVQQQELEQTLQDVHFDFDRYDLSPQDRQALQSDANWLKANPNVYITIRGRPTNAAVLFTISRYRRSGQRPLAMPWSKSTRSLFPLVRLQATREPRPSLSVAYNLLCPVSFLVNRISSNCRLLSGLPS